MSTRFFHEIYELWEKKQRKKYEKILDILKENSIEITRCKTLNIGCDGFFLEKFLIEKGLIPKIFVSIDIEKSVLEQYNHLRKVLFKEKINFILGSGDALPFHKDSFDLIFCIDVAHLLIDLEDIHLALATNGYLVLSSFFNLSEKDKMIEKFTQKLNRFKILKEILLFDEENEIIFLSKKVI